jgi:hypothetical protein
MARSACPTRRLTLELLWHPWGQAAAAHGWSSMHRRVKYWLSVEPRVGWEWAGFTSGCEKIEPGPFVLCCKLIAAARTRAISHRVYEIVVPQSLGVHRETNDGWPAERLARPPSVKKPGKICPGFLPGCPWKRAPHSTTPPTVSIGAVTFLVMRRGQVQSEPALLTPPVYFFIASLVLSTPSSIFSPAFSMGPLGLTTS